MVLLTQLMDPHQTMAAALHAHHAHSENEDLAKTKSQMALQNALLVHQSARPLPFSINNILHQVRIAFKKVSYDRIYRTKNRFAQFVLFFQIIP